MEGALVLPSQSEIYHAHVDNCCKRVLSVISNDFLLFSILYPFRGRVPLCVFPQEKMKSSSLALPLIIKLS